MSNTLKFLLGLLLLSSTFVACNQKKDQATEEAKDWYIDPRESTHMQRTMTDTLAVLYNTKQYLNYLKANELDSALNMLYELSGDSVLPLSVDGKNQMMRTYKAFPVQDYEIDRLQMFSETTSELHYTIHYGEVDEQNPAKNTIKCVLMPVRVGYYWYLTVPNVNRQVNPENLIE